MPEIVKRIAHVLKIGAVAGLAVGIVRVVRGSTPPQVTGQASWPPLADDPATETRSGPVRFTAVPTETEAEPETGTVTASTTEQRWVAPVDGACPVSHPIKGNADSGIFHVPGGMSYDRTVPERCYATAADAEADGFRQAKR